MPNHPPNHRAELWPTHSCVLVNLTTLECQELTFSTTLERKQNPELEKLRATAVRGRDHGRWATGARDVHLTPYGYGGRGGGLNKLFTKTTFLDCSWCMLLPLLAERYVVYILSLLLVIHYVNLSLCKYSTLAKSSGTTYYSSLHSWFISYHWRLKLSPFKPMGGITLTTNM